VLALDIALDNAYIQWERSQMFRVSIASTETCDKCRKPSQPNNLLLQLYQAARGEDRNMIFVHKLCLEKAITNAITEMGEVTQ
jgi:hypothetical protein